MIESETFIFPLKPRCHPECRDLVEPTAGLPVFLVFLALLALPISLPGQLSAQFVRSSRLAIENDGLVLWTPPHERTDRYYTNGLTAEAVLAWAPRWTGLLTRDTRNVCPTDPGSDPCVLTRLAAGQAIFTPDWLFDPIPLEGDRPYAGWLYVNATTSLFTPQGSRSLGIEVGVTGEPSLAGPAHRWVHQALGKAEPQGWDQQIPFELAFAVNYESRIIVARIAREAGPSIQLEPHGSVSLGTLRTGGVGGITLKAGWNVPPHLDWFGKGPGSVYLLCSAGVEAELVLRDLFLDGSTWRDSPNADRTPFVGRAHIGFEVGAGPIGLAFAVTRSSIQFRKQLSSHSVGEIGVIIRP